MRSRDVDQRLDTERTNDKLAEPTMQCENPRLALDRKITARTKITRDQIHGATHVALRPLTRMLTQRRDLSTRYRPGPGV